MSDRPEIPPAVRPPAAPPPLRVTRRGVLRLAQLGGTIGALGIAAVSCGIRLDGGGSAAAAADAGPAAAAADAGPATAPRVGAAGRTPLPTTGATGGAATASGPRSPAQRAAGPDAAGQLGSGQTGRSGKQAVPSSPLSAPADLPGIGSTWNARLTGHDQVVLVSAADSAATRNVVRWFDRTVDAAGAQRWALRSTVAGWNGAGGWTTDHTVGDGRSPVGMYGLTDAGGFDPNPGTRVPYQYSTAEYSEMLNGVRTFAHVLAIDYNRVVGTPPSNSVRPGGWFKGGSIWVHVEHDSPTQACVGIPDASLVDLLRWLRPAARPVILMGPTAILAT